MTRSLQYLIELRTAHRSPLTAHFSPLTPCRFPLRHLLRQSAIRNSQFEIKTLSLCPLWLKASFPGAVIDGVSFVDCVFRGVRASEVVEASGSILLRNVKIEPAEKAEV